MEKVFDMHVHHLFDIPMKESIDIFKEEFAATGTYKYTFLSVPNEGNPDGTLLFKEAQNVKVLYLKKIFSPNSYAYAGLEHSLEEVDRDDEEVSKNYLRQAECYMNAGFDGMKMLEGYPAMRKAMKRPLDHNVYDRYYSFLEENGIPVTMHVANPVEYWDISKLDEWTIKKGRACDETFPKKNELTEEVMRVVKKHPKLRLTLAHFGFMTYDIEDAKRWLSYENTMFDITPGGEQLLNIRKDWEKWQDFFIQYSDRIMYGTDFYAFPKDDKWEKSFTRRPKFVRQLLETDGEHEYVGVKFVGLKIEKELRDKIYRLNAERELGSPKTVNIGWLSKEAERVLNIPDKKEAYADSDMRYILDNL